MIYTYVQQFIFSDRLRFYYKQVFYTVKNWK